MAILYTEIRGWKTGLFALIGFLLFGIEPLLNFLLYQVLLKTLMPYQQVFLAYPCISGATFLLGCIALMIALFSGARPNPAPSIRQCQYCGALLAPGVQVCDRCGQPAYR